MEVARNKQTSLLMWTLVAGLLSQNLLIPVMSIPSVRDQKNYYPPDPHSGSPRGRSHRSPSHGYVPSPSHGSGGGSYGSSPPYHRTPSHGGGSYGGGSPPSSNCGTPPSGGGGHYDPSPAPPTPTGGGGGGGYYNPPPPIIETPPTPSTVPPPVTLTPPTPIIEPGTPSTPGIPIPSPPYSFDPNSPPFTCTYWKTHPGLIWGLLGWFGTMGGAFGVTSLPGFGPNLSLQQALSNVRTDGFGELYREGTASLLNSMVDKTFPITTKQVRDSFISAIKSNKAAAAQAQLFKLANEGRLKPRA